jgi:hypothetical protein
VDDFPRVLQEDLARRGKHNLPLGPVEQLDTQLLFQPGHRRRQRRLHDVDPLGRPGEVQLAGHRNEVLQLP